MVHSLNRVLCCVAALAFIFPFEAASQETEVHGTAILVRTVHLESDVESAKQILLYGMLGGDGVLVLDPNYCQLDDFGDPLACTDMAPQHRQVALELARIPDPAGRGRSVYGIRNSGLRGSLLLVVPSEEGTDSYRFVYTNGSHRRVITAERLVYDQTAAEPSRHGEITFQRYGRVEKDKCQPIDFEEAKVFPGIVNNTFILLVSGTKPNLNMDVRLYPRLYVRQPEYWGIDLVGCLPGDVAIPTTAPYVVQLPLDGIIGTKGIEVIGKTMVQKLAVPPENN